MKIPKLHPVLRILLHIFVTSIIVVLEIASGSAGYSRFVYAFLAVALLSSEAQMVWAAVLLCRFGTLSLTDTAGLSGALTFHFVAFRICFVWTMLVFGRLLASTPVVRFFARLLSKNARLARFAVVSAALALAMCAVIFRVDLPVEMLVAACLLIYIARKLPRPTEPRTFGATELGLTVGSVLLCAIVFEIAIRVVGGTPNMLKGFMYMPHPEAIFCMKPNSSAEQISPDFRETYVVGDHGWRDRPFGKKGPDTIRILCMGDSYVLGVGVELEQTLSKVLEQEFRDHSNTKTVEVVNCGTVGYGLWQQLAILDERGLPLDPDYILLQVHPGNDVRDALIKVGKYIRCYDPVYHGRIQGWQSKKPHRLVHRLRSTSHGFEFLYSRLGTLGFRPPHVRALFGGAPRAKDFPPREEGREWYWESHLKDYYAELYEGWEIMDESLGRFAEICEERDIGLAVFPMPTREEIYPERTTAKLREEGVDPDIYDLTKAEKLTIDMCRRNNVQYIDLYGPMKEQRDGEPGLYFWHDGHINTRGHRLCGEELFRFLITDDNTGLFDDLRRDEDPKSDLGSETGG